VTTAERSYDLFNPMSHLGFRLAMGQADWRRAA
jgi:hypothetical protein